MLATFRAVSVISLLVLIGCGPQATQGGSQGAARSQAAVAPKRLVIAIISEPVGFHPAIETQRLSITQAGLTYYLFPGLTVIDHQEVLRPTLAEAVPSAENGLWKLFPDGRMETTHPIRPGALWHDGNPLTGEDLRFTYTVVSDRELPEFSTPGVNLIERVEAGPLSAVVTWKQPFINADALFSTGNLNRTGPLPRHLLQEEYLANKAGFTELRYWSEDFVGLGPYRLKEWARGNHIVLAAFDGYVLGRPKIDEIDVRFIPDPNTMIANMLSGAIDLPFGSIVGMDQAVPIKEQWREGQVTMEAAGWVVAYAQSIDPQPRIVLNPQFRKALLHAVDRQQMADTLMNGLLPVAHSVFAPGMPEYDATEASIVRYDYDPRRASRMLEELGFSKGADGTLRDSRGDSLQLEVRSYAQRDIHHKTLFVLVDHWRQIGIAAEPVALSADRARDAREQATFPTFLVLRQPHGVDRMVAFHSGQARTAERNYQGSNNGRYQNAELDGLIERYQMTVALADRMQIGGQIVRHLTDQLPTLPFFYDALPVFLSNRLLNVHPSGNLAWNIHEWDLRS